MKLVIQNSKFKMQTLWRRRHRLAAVFAFCILHFAFASAASAQAPNFFTGLSDPGGPPSSLKPAQLKEVTFRQRLNEQLPLDAAFKDEYGRPVTLGKYFNNDKPVIVAFVYYSCPMLCTQVLNGISSSLRALSFTAGQEFDVVVISFDPRDNPATALEKKQSHLAYWHTEQTTGGWHLLTGDEATITRVTSAAGFTYAFDKATGQYAHVSGILVTTPEGRLARYFYGIEYSPKELRLALVESGRGHIGSVIDELLLFCYHYDPETGRYGATVMNLVRAAGVLTVAAMATFMFVMWRRDAHPPLAQ
jgi:protein SCO1/2